MQTAGFYREPFNALLDRDFRMDGADEHIDGRATRRTRIQSAERSYRLIVHHVSGT